VFPLSAAAQSPPPVPAGKAGKSPGPQPAGQGISPLVSAKHSCVSLTTPPTGGFAGVSAQEEKRGRLLALAAELADHFPTRAAEHDQNNTFPFENVARMKETGYTALVLPEEYGGLGADLVDFCLCQERLAQGCGATALAINMHLFGLGSLGEPCDPLPSRPHQS